MTVKVIAVDFVIFYRFWVFCR